MSTETRTNSEPMLLWHVREAAKTGEVQVVLYGKGAVAGAHAAHFVEEYEAHIRAVRAEAIWDFVNESSHASALLAAYNGGQLYDIAEHYIETEVQP